MIADGWTAEAKAALNLRPESSTGSREWLRLHLDIAIRPIDDSNETSGWIPLALPDLFALLYVPFTALLEEIAPAVLPAVTGGEHPSLNAVGCVLIPNSDSFSRYFRFRDYASGPVEGASDATGIEWYATRLDELDTVEARTETVCERLEELFADGGYQHYEAAVASLAPPALPSLPPS
jgi:hypothetical protein